MGCSKTESARDRLSRALLQLMKEKNLKKIKVSEITEQAGVNRSTFYKYYKDIFDLYDSVCDDTLRKIFTPYFRSKENICFRSTADAAAFLLRVRGSILPYVERLKVLCGKNGEASFTYRLRNYYTELFSTVPRFDMHFPISRRSAVEFVGDVFALFTVDEIESEYLSSDPALYRDDFHFDFSKTVTENTADYLAAFEKGEKRNYPKAFLKTFVEFAANNGFKPFPVSPFMKAIDLPRTVIYTRFANIKDMIICFYTGFACVVAEYITLVVFADEKDFERVLLARETDYTFLADAFKNPRNEQILLDFFSSVRKITERKCFDKRKEQTGEDLSGEKAELFRLYICCVMRSVRYYLVDADESTFLSDLRLYRRLFDPDALSYL